MTGTKTGKGRDGSRTAAKRARRGRLVGKTARRFGFRRPSNPRGVRPVASATRRSRVSSTRWFVDARPRRLASRRVLSALVFATSSPTIFGSTVSHRALPAPRGTSPRTRRGSRRRARRARGRDERRARRRDVNARRGGRERRRGPGRAAIARDASRSGKRRVALARNTRRGPAMDWAAADAASGRVQRERRERRERQRMTMAPDTCPRRRTGTPYRRRPGRGRGGGGGRGAPRAGGANVGARARAVRRRAGWGSPPSVEPQRVAVAGRRLGRGRDARVCTHCHIEPAPSGMNMNLVKHCYACGGAL